MFHDNKPSRRTLYKTMESIRKYCFADDPVKIKIVSDQSKNFPNFKTVNYEDPNFNIATPIFVIHGNHDDPAGDGQYSALDILSVCNMVNYFGKSNNIDEITVYPILITKGTTKLALYGMGNIRDERLYRTFQQKKVKLMRPVEMRDEWFNLMVLHQNRVAHNPKNYVQEAMLDSFLNLIMWGHEHECLIAPTPSTEAGFWVTQPGSTIATSLSEFEAKKKHIGLLEVCGNQFRMKPIPLTTVRPYIIDEVTLSAEPDLKPEEMDKVRQFLSDKVEEMIKIASQSEGKQGAIPLIRLKVEYSGFPAINPAQFGQQFVGRVANPDDILNMWRRKKPTKLVRGDGKEAEEELFNRAVRPEPLDDTKIEDLIYEFLGPHSGAGTVELLVENDFTSALYKYVEKDDNKSIADFVTKQLQESQDFLKKQNPDRTKNAEDIQKLVVEHSKQQQQIKNLQKDINSSQALLPAADTTDGGNIDDKFDDVDIPSPTASSTSASQSTKSKGKTTKTKKTTTKKTTKSTKSKKKVLSDEEDNAKSDLSDDDKVMIIDDDDFSTSSTTTATKKKTTKSSQKPALNFTQVKVKSDPISSLPSSSQVQAQSQTSSQSLKRTRPDTFLTPQPPSKKSKTTTSGVKSESTPSKSAGILLNFLSDDTASQASQNDNTAMSSSQNSSPSVSKKWGKSKNSFV
eukprot:TRINITY_DN4906_c2_g1_i1.p1 TRINITY_DN4906_c2_g1~~TRINITY_DN4906_c2_g1_i1.p1  ORF type:complete len:745 (-),score=229.28 TRINITY_DN4906_c2_g1_i1:59-2110(-)